MGVFKLLRENALGELMGVLEVDDALLLSPKASFFIYWSCGVHYCRGIVAKDNPLVALSTCISFGSGTKRAIIKHSVNKRTKNASFICIGISDYPKKTCLDRWIPKTSLKDYDYRLAVRLYRQRQQPKMMEKGSTTPRQTISHALSAAVSLSWVVRQDVEPIARIFIRGLLGMN